MLLLAIDQPINLIFPLIGVALALLISRVEDRSPAAITLFALAPALLFRVAMGQRAEEYHFMFILFFTLFHTSALYFITHQVMRLLNVPLPMRRIYLLNVVLIGFYGLRRLQPMWPDPQQGVPIVNSIFFFHLIVFALLGVYLASGREYWTERFGDVLRSPLVYVVIAGLAMGLMAVEVPYNLLETVDSLYDMTIPMALIVAGITLGRGMNLLELDQTASHLGGVGICALIRLVVSPALALCIVPMMGIEDVYLKQALVYSAAAPTGVFAVVLAAFYGRTAEKRFTVLCVLLTAVLSLATAPLVGVAVNYYLPIVTEAVTP
ncbi:MAG: hypothetical protein GC154_03475 [bacterium]|nr:hypothetical protein [bacterium]